MPASEILARVRANRTISADDALAVRRLVYGDDGAIKASELEAMLEIDDAADKADVTWTQLVSEAGADFLVHQQPPAGYISRENADWLTDRIVRNGVVKTPRQFEMLVHALELSTSAPSALAGLALSQIRMAIVDGEGPLAGDLSDRRVDRAEADLIRRVLYAFGGPGGVAVSHPEAEALFDINDAVAGEKNDPAWDDLFVKAIANFMMAVSGYTPPSRDVALARAEWLDEPTSGIGGFFSKMAAGGLRGILNAYREGSDDGWADRTNRKIDEMVAAEPISEGEAGWLAERIGRDGGLHDNEKALLRFIRDEAPSIHPSLAALIDKAA